MTLLTCSWVLAFQNRQKVGIFLSDIAAAFDRVDRELLLRKLAGTGLNKTLLDFLADYLRPRLAEVVVNGAASRQLELSDMVFQGTVLGPSLWNVFFADVHEAAEAAGGTETKFADDLSVYKTFALQTANEEVRDDLKKSQASVHKWGELNRVTFDAAKEHFCVLHPTEGEGADFRLLGPVFDCKLTMDSAVAKVVQKARGKLAALLRTQRFYSTEELVAQFKTHVLSVLESCQGAVYHASATTLEPLDRVRNSFVREVGLDSRTAFVQHNLAPTELRRDVAMLGFLHKVALGTAHPYTQNLFPPAPKEQNPHQRTRLSQRRHNLQLQDRVLYFTQRPLEVLRRSVFALVKVYNLLPPAWVTGDVTHLQKCLTAAARRACADGADDWETLFSPRKTLRCNLWCY